MPLALTAGAQVREWLHIDDAVEALCCVIQRPKMTGVEFVNVGTGVGLSIAELLTTIARLSKSDQQKSVIKLGALRYRDGEAHDLVMDCSCALQVFDFKPQRRLEEGLGQVISFSLSRDPQKIITDDPRP
jgi:nucleoside-diphosphate-sugar epimerase